MIFNLHNYFYLLLVIASTTTSTLLYLCSTNRILQDDTIHGRGLEIRQLLPERDGPSAADPLSSFYRKQQPPPSSSSSRSARTDASNKEKCAVLLFGLPRAFRTIVLPSLIQNVLRPTVAKYNCDVYAHYYQVNYEPPGRGHQGGAIEQDAVLLLRQAVADSVATTTTAASAPAVHIISDTEEQFWSQRNATVHKYRTTLIDGDDYNNNNNSNSTGKYLYFPWKDRGYLYPLSLDNIVKQWHSISAVFEKMDATCPRCYERIAMLRLDVFYATPIDIYQLNNQTRDTSNRYAVVPAFGKHPVNDRMVYGPYRAVKIWATERFRRIEEHVRTYEPGYGMHSERFLNHSILPAMKRQAGVRGVRENPDICFMRVRAAGSIWTWDCGTRGGMGNVNKRELIESILQRNCTQSTLSSGAKLTICNE